MPESRELFPGAGTSSWADALPGERSGFYRRAGIGGLLSTLYARLRPWPGQVRTLEKLDSETGGIRRLKTAEIGELGEKVAAQYLVSQGLRVLWRNFVGIGGGEIDLVLRDGQTLVFCEVKTRTSMKWGRPADAVDAEKRRYLSLGAQKWLKMLGLPTIAFRFDIIEIVLERGRSPKINLIKGAFTLSKHFTYT